MNNDLSNDSFNPLAHCPTDAERNESDTAFCQQLQTALRDRALPLFEETARYAIENGIDAQVEVAIEDHRSPRISLRAKHPEDQTSSAYSIIGDVAKHGIVHQEFYADTAVTQRQAALLPSINEKVIDTHLATFFSKAFAMPLPPALNRHPSGFW